MGNGMPRVGCECKHYVFNSVECVMTGIEEGTMKQHRDLRDKLTLQEKVLVECGQKLAELKEQMQKWKTVKDSFYSRDRNPRIALSWLQLYDQRRRSSFSAPPT